MSNSPSPVGLGAITIATMLLVSALATFSILTLSTAQADSRLSQTHADAMTRYYAADAQAVAYYDSFLLGDAPSLSVYIPMSEQQGMQLELRREVDGSVTILSWQTVIWEEETLEDSPNLWDGSALPS